MIAEYLTTWALQDRLEDQLISASLRMLCRLVSGPAPSRTSQRPVSQSSPENPCLFSPNKCSDPNLLTRPAIAHISTVAEPPAAFSQPADPSSALPPWASTGVPGSWVLGERYAVTPQIFSTDTLFVFQSKPRSIRPLSEPDSLQCSIASFAELYPISSASVIAAKIA